MTILSLRKVTFGLYILKTSQNNLFKNFEKEKFRTEFLE